MSEDMREIGERIKSRMPEGMTQQLSLIHI